MQLAKSLSVLMLKILASEEEAPIGQGLYVLELMWEIVLVDDVLDVFEAQLMRRVSGLLYISDVDSGNSKKRALLKIKNNN